MTARMSAIEGISGLFLINLSFSHFDRCCRKSTRNRNCRIEFWNNRIGAFRSLNRDCVFALDLESILLSGLSRNPFSAVSTQTGLEPPPRSWLSISVWLPPGRGERTVPRSGRTEAWQRLHFHRSICHAAMCGAADRGRLEHYFLLGSSAGLTYVMANGPCPCTWTTVSLVVQA
jgi:hypothetical protein